MSRRERGYRFENRITKRYNKHGWKAWRLGASSVGLPDVLAVGVDAVHVHELKTTIGESVRVPAHQIARCMEVAAAFNKYDRRVVLSAYFVRRVEYHYVWTGTKPEPVIINERGETHCDNVVPRTWHELLGGDV